MFNAIRIFIVLSMVLSAHVAAAQNLQFASNERENGTAFFALDSRSGQLSYMVDYGDTPGIWTNYGPPIGSLGVGKFLLQANEREHGSAFFAMESMSGQLYYMLDYGEEAGKWVKYGSRIGSNSYAFEASEREHGTAFFAIDVTTGQGYYMLDYGDHPGHWMPYGGVIGK